MEAERIDKYCEDIFLTLVTINDRIRLNQLHRTLKKYSIKMTKVTLLHHLDHLRKQGTVLRIKEKKQKVYYSLNWDKLKELQQAKNLSEREKNYISDKRMLKSKSLSQQVIFITDLFAVGDLLRLKLMTLEILEPQNRLQHYLESAYITAFNKMYARMLLTPCTKSKEKAQELLQTIDKQLDELTIPLTRYSSKPT